MTTPQFDNNQAQPTLAGDGPASFFFKTTLNNAPVSVASGYTAQLWVTQQNSVPANPANSFWAAGPQSVTTGVTFAYSTTGVTMNITKAGMAGLLLTRYNFAMSVSNDSDTTDSIIASGALNINYPLGAPVGV